MKTKKCTKCGETKSLGEYHKSKKTRDGRKPACASCTNAALKDWHDRNPEKRVAYGKKDYELNKEERKQSAKEYYRANKDSVRDRLAEYNRENSEKIRESGKKRRNAPEAKNKKSEYDRKYRAKNKKRISALQKNYRIKNSDKIKSSKKVHKHKRRAVERNASGSFTAEQWRSRLDYYGGKCIYCGCSENIHADHRIPLSRGGTNWPSNLAPACRDCNLSKHTKTEFEFKALLSKEN